MEKIFRKKKPGILVTLVMVAVMPISAFLAITAKNLDTSRSFLRGIFEIVPAIIWKPFLALLAAWLAIIGLAGFLGSHKSRLVLNDRGASYESGLPAWWPDEKSVSMPWGEAEALVFPTVGYTMKNHPIVLKSKAGQITIADGSYAEYGEILEEIGKHVKFKGAFS